MKPIDTIDKKAVSAALDDSHFSNFVKEQTKFITYCAYQATNKYISKSDDEWSIALISFSQAVKTYSPTKGGFLPYAQKIITHGLIDYYRSNKKFNSEISINPNIFEVDTEEDSLDLAMKISVAKKIAMKEDTSIKDEIEAINQVFTSFGFSFLSLTKCSPKSNKTKIACKKAILYILDHPLLKFEIYHLKQLPLQKIQKKTNLPRKLLEHHRRYIIAAIEILSGEYPHLAEYLSFIRKDGI